MEFYKSKIIILTILSFSFLVISTNSGLNSVSGSNSSEGKVIYEPVVEVLDLAQNGTLLAPYIVNLTEDFLIVQRLIWHLHFTTNTIDFDNFGDDTPLTNGINVLYNGISLLGNVNITANSHFAHDSYDLTILSDDKNPKDNMLISRLSFSKFTDEGLYINNARQLQFYIQDDMTSGTLTSISMFNVTVQGFKRINNDFIKPFDLYYPNVINPIIINDLYIGVEYQVRINTSSGRTDKWVNFTAISDTINIKLFLRDLDDDDLVLFIYLYEEDQYVDVMSVPIQSQSLDFLSSIFAFVPYAGVLLILVVFVAMILGESKRRFL